MRRQLAYEDDHEWVTARVYATARGWIIEVDRAITGELTAERWALDYTPDLPQGSDLEAVWNEGMTYGDIVIARMHSGRCLRRGYEVQ